LEHFSPSEEKSGAKIIAEKMTLETFTAPDFFILVLLV
jgi:hypothetical protein